MAYESRSVEGCFILYDLRRDTSMIYNIERAHQSFLPASTYKIPNSLIALECKVVKDEREIIHWDSTMRPVAIWNQDHNMATGIKYSVVWFYQELARRIGAERMQSWVNRIEYGNRQIGRNIDDFWLEGELRISPVQQIEFLKKLIENDLPFKKRHIETVKTILIEDENDHYVFRAKTGWSVHGTPVGWYVGYLEINDNTYIFVNNIEITESKDAKARKEIVREIFKHIFDINLNI
ncbi:MAG: class D beta-lactamase [Cytophagales bacterium]|nr:class D beta-lactamase [Cytophagales bacterium]